MEEKIKNSVRLPKTDFSMKANLASLEKNVLQAWQDKDIYKKVTDKNSNKEIFILHDGPPYANGHLHVGHALNKILKDIIVKSHITMGHHAPYVMGWDCHGLPIEWKIEEKYKENKITKDSVSIPVFRKECKEFADYWVNIQQEEFKQLGVIADYDNPYLTTHKIAEKTIVSAILQLLKEEVIYQGKKPVLWSVIEKTALAEAEVEYKDIISDAIYVGFKITKFTKLEWLSASIMIWTTTPWTIPANQAVAYGKDIVYGLYEITETMDGSLAKIGDRVVIAIENHIEVFKNIKVSGKKLDSSLGLIDMEVQHPLHSKGYNYVIPLLAGDFIEIGTGTGLVHMAPAHGEDDFYLCKKYNIVPTELVLDDGKYTENTLIFAGQHIFKVAPHVIEVLKENGSLFASSQITHSYPHSWRSKAPLVYRLTTQWFISLDKNNTREKALASLDSIEFYPKTGKNRLASMIANRPDWCISRQRSWGVPLGIFVNKVSKKPLIDDEVFSNVINAFAQEGSDAWFSDDPRRFLTNKYNKEDFYAVNDVVDVWVDSGLTHNYVLQNRDNLNFPADLYLEGSDQHRGWFQSSLMMSLLIFGKSPYKKILTHGFIIDENHQKMSKSVGNVTSPKQIIQDYGADILRLWVANSNFVEDVSLSKNILTQQVEAYRKIRNTLRYLIANVGDSNNKDVSNLELIDKWVLYNVYELDTLFVKTFSDNFSAHLFFNKLFNFMITDLSAIYFDIKKDILYCDADNSSRYMGTLSVLNILFDFMLKWLTPFITFTMEEAYAVRYKKPLGELFLSEFPINSNIYDNKESFVKFQRILDIRRVVTGCLELKRSAKEIGSSLEATPVVFVKNEDKILLQEVVFDEICITSGIIIKDMSDMKPNSDYFTLSEVKDVYVEFYKVIGDKCERCWRYYSHLENNLCRRCRDV